MVMALFGIPASLAAFSGKRLALREPGYPPRTRLEESETGPARFAGPVFCKKAGQRRTFQKKVQKISNHLLLFSLSVL